MRTPGQVGNPLDDARRELGLVPGHLVHADRLEIPHGFGERDRLRYRLRAGLETMRRRQELGGLERDAGDGRPAGAGGRQHIEQLFAAVEHADAVRPEHLVRRERGEVDAHRPEIGRTMRHRLARVEHDPGAACVRERHDIGDRCEVPRDVRDLGDRHDARSVAEFGGEVVGRPQPVLVDPHGAQPRARLGRETLPWDEVRVVLGLGDDDLVAGFERERASGCPAQPRARIGDAEGDHVDGVGGVLSPHDLALARTHESGDGGAGVLEERRRVAHGCTRAAVHGSEVVLEVLALGVEHLARSAARWRRSRGRRWGGCRRAYWLKAGKSRRRSLMLIPSIVPRMGGCGPGAVERRPPRHSCIHAVAGWARLRVRRGGVYITRERDEMRSE